MPTDSPRAAADLHGSAPDEDAYLRGYELVVPRDGVASRTSVDTRRALAQMRRGLRADTRPSTELDLDALTRRSDPGRRPEQPRA